MPVGTGFLVGPDTLLTNYHVLRTVIEGPDKPADVRFRFGYKKLKNLEVSLGQLAELQPNDWLIDYSPYSESERIGKPDQALPTEDELDYALVRLSGALGRDPVDPATPGSPVRGWVRLPTTDPPLYPNMPLLILQHPRAAPLKLGIDTKGVIGENANHTRVRYATNSEAGSSGSPCFDMDWGLVALHHYGDPAFNHPRYNQGIPIRMIRERLVRNKKGDALGGEVA